MHGGGNHAEWVHAELGVWGTGNWQVRIAGSNNGGNKREVPQAWERQGVCSGGQVGSLAGVQGGWGVGRKKCRQKEQGQGTGVNGKAWFQVEKP